MGIYVVTGPHPLLPKNCRYLEDIEGGFVIPTTMEMDDGLYKPYRQYGVAVPLHLIRDCVLKIKKHGIDEEGHRGQN